MIQYPKPKKPADFDEFVKVEKDKSELFFNNPNTRDEEKKVYKFISKWGKFKDTLFKHQYKKCGYCEQKINVAPGDVEHFRPKGEIAKLPLLENMGEETINNMVKGRKPRKQSAIGYWWLAYEWENYLLSCDPCNQRWKKSVFPVNQDKYHIQKSQNHLEKPLLLHPFDQNIDPKDHLEFTNAGGIKPKNNSAHGLNTIHTCGLHRPSLIDARLQKIAEVAIHIKFFKETKKNDFLKYIYRLGRTNQPFAGLVRWLFEANFGVNWSQLESMFIDSLPSIEEEILGILRPTE